MWASCLLVWAGALDQTLLDERCAYLTFGSISQLSDKLLLLFAFSPVRSRGPVSPYPAPPTFYLYILLIFDKAIFAEDTKFKKIQRSIQ